MKKDQPKEVRNFILMRMFEGEKCLTTIELQSYHLTNMRHLITDISDNYSGGITIWIDIQLQQSI